MGQGRVQVVVGGQWGSESKGAIAAYLASYEGRGWTDSKEVMAVRVAGPNAGHTAIDDEGRRWALRQIPAIAVRNLDAKLVIAAGSEIDEEVLHDEVERLDRAGFDVSGRLVVDYNATVVEDHHKKLEGVIDHGTTGKGIGAARAARCMREATLYGQARENNGALVDGSNTERIIREWLQNGRRVIIEGTQGYGLGSHAGEYPFVTSSDCRAIDFLAMAGVTPWAPWVDRVEPWVVLRTYPIRIAGNSGPMHAELTWEELSRRTNGHITPEITTVTRKIRRVGEWDPLLARRAVIANGGLHVNVALGFLDYVFPELAGASDKHQLRNNHWTWLNLLEEQIGAPIMLVGTGPASTIDLRPYDAR